MTSWQDEPIGSPFARGGADPSGRPLSRREAREAERRAAETMLEKPPHPSGVVDFEAHDFSSDFTPDQDFAVGDTQDIWRALTRGAQPEATRDARAPEAGAMPETMDRVREALLRRRAQTGPADTVRTPQQRPPAFEASAFPAGVFDEQAAPQQTADHGFSRRELRRREAAGQREDGLPADLFAERRPEPAQPEFDEYAAYEQGHAQQGQYGQQYDDDYYDEPYSPEPTIAIPVRDAAPAPAPASEPPRSYDEPRGDDALTFSSAAPQSRAQAWTAWSEEEDDDLDEADDSWEEPQRAIAQPRPASGPVSFLEPQQSAFGGAQVGPPSEVTDLAGFEALIRKARQQPAQPAAQAPKPALAWADDEEAQEGFGSLLSRQVQSSHGTSPALILPNDPQPVDLTQAVSGTGDIFITGSMKLSNRFSSTGVSEEHYDSHDIDRLYDASQDEPAAGVAPKRAANAVSGAPHNRVVTGRPSRGNLVPTVLAIVAGAMAVGVVTLLVGSWIFKIF
ncbi:hypothetical protein [Amnibacterium endophyticum]|uniref:Uncharacterized protein n=1 Tax=Amnibacterium endophyticum TaxID=2109337 RepID=A0ABW4LG27_9MICO